MVVNGSIRDVARQRATRKIEGKPTTREAVAEVARYLIAYSSLQNKEVIEAGGKMMSQTVFYNIMRGDVVSDVKLSVLAGILSSHGAERLPVNTFRLMVAGDIKAIEKLEMAAHLKQYILDVLNNSDVPQRRRVTDS